MRKWLISCLLLVFLFSSFLAIAGAQELVFWNWPFHIEPMKSVVVPWFNENVSKVLPEGVTVAEDFGSPTYDDNRKNFILQAETGRPDVVEGLLEYMLAYKQMGLIEPLTELFTKWDEKDQFIQPAIDALTVDGELWGIPYVVNVRLLLYRKSIFEKHGLSVPKTWDELVEVSSKITELENSQMFGISLTSETGEPRVFQEFISFFFQISDGIFVQKDGKWVLNATPEQFASVLKLYYDLMWAKETPGMNPEERGLGGSAQDVGFIQGNYAMVSAGPWMIGYSHDYPEVLADIGLTALPVAPGGKQATYMEVKPIMINKHSQNKDLAWELVKFVTSKDFIALENSTEGANPPRKDVAELTKFSEDPWQKVFIENLSTGCVLEPVNWELPQRFITNAIQSVLYKQATPEEAGAKLYDDLKKALEEGNII